MQFCRIYGVFDHAEKEESFDNWELTKKEKSFIVEVLWDTKFDRGSMQIFFDHPLG